MPNLKHFCKIGKSTSAKANVWVCGRNTHLQMAPLKSFLVLLRGAPWSCNPWGAQAKVLFSGPITTGTAHCAAACFRNYNASPSASPLRASSFCELHAGSGGPFNYECSGGRSGFVGIFTRGPEMWGRCGRFFVKKKQNVGPFQGHKLGSVNIVRFWLRRHESVTSPEKCQAYSKDGFTGDCTLYKDYTCDEAI